MFQVDQVGCAVASYKGEESLIVVGGIHGDGVEVWALSLEKQDSNWQLLPLLPTQRLFSKLIHLRE